jgi:hypothetical protein
MPPEELGWQRPEKTGHGIGQNLHVLRTPCPHTRHEYERAPNLA